MKKINIILITLVVLVSGCTDFLTLKPQDELIREEYWKTGDDVQAVVGEAYAKLNNIIDDVYYWAELRGGLISPDPKNADVSTLEFFNFNINTYNEKTQWKDFYSIINLANTIIEYAPSAKENDQTFTEVAFNGYMAEAYYLRALSYFYLVRAFKEVPFITKSYSTDDQNFDFVKSGEQEIIDQLISDLNSQVDNAFETSYFIGVANQKGRITRNAYHALLADLYLWNNDYQSCITECQKINGVVFEDGETYFDIYAGKGNSDESIFELQFDYNLYNTTNDLYEITSNNSQGSKETIVSEMLIAMYNLTDFRQYNPEGFDVTYNQRSLSIWKYEGLSPFDMAERNRVDRTKSRSDANWIFYRLADIRLMMAEAYAELDQLDNALVELNRIRRRAGIIDYTDATNKRKLIYEILDERARELVGEGKRWFDLVRVTRRDINARLPKMSEAVISNVDTRSRSAVATKLKDSNSWFLPIFYEELIFNKSLVQNSFYE